MKYVAYGMFCPSTDDKLRVAIPKQVRTVLGGEEGQGVYVAPGTDGSLAIYTESAFSRLADRINEVSPTRQDMGFTRLFYARAQRPEIDSQGRIRIPQELATLARLQKEVVLLGVQDHMELWAVESWNSYLEEKQSHYDAIAEAALGHPES